MKVVVLLVSSVASHGNSHECYSVLAGIYKLKTGNEDRQSVKLESQVSHGCLKSDSLK